MSVEIIDAAGKLLQLKVRGMFKKADYDRMIHIAKESIEREGKVRALVFLEAFEDWDRRGDWGDVSFMTEHGRHIEKMAIVGDEKWKDDALAFTAKGFRATAIEFFTPSRLSEARTWLGS
ncbi:MAG: STAS/SEC14 domain-containing protein [Candidatus Binatia bacterium]